MSNVDVDLPSTAVVVQMTEGSVNVPVIGSSPGGTGGGFDGVHNDLDGRSTADAHPISAITGLTAALEAGGASALADLTDVDVTTDPPAPDDVLAWDGTNWTPATLDGGSGLELGETSTTAYRGDRGKTAFDHSQVVTGNPHGTTAADVGAVPAIGGVSIENIGAIESNVNVVAATGATETLDLSTYGVHDCTMDQACTFTFSNPAPSGKATIFTLIVRGAFTPTLPASIDWAGTAPTYTTPSQYVFTTVDGGTTYLGQQVGKGFA